MIFEINNFSGFTVFFIFISSVLFLFLVWVGASIISLNGHIKKLVRLEYQKYQDSKKVEKDFNYENSISSEFRPDRPAE